MRILIVGNGGREHALLWKLRRDAPDAEFFATQPNGGMAPICEARYGLGLFCLLAASIATRASICRPNL